MSKAEEVAMEHCCVKCVHDKLGCSMKVLHNGRDCIKCGNYIKGYQQAEKDLANAREETIKEVCEWINNHLNDDYISVDEESVRVGCPYSYLETNLFIEDLKKHFS